MVVGPSVTDYACMVQPSTIYPIPSSATKIWNTVSADLYPPTLCKNCGYVFYLWLSFRGDIRRTASKSCLDKSASSRQRRQFFLSEILNSTDVTPARCCYHLWLFAGFLKAFCWILSLSTGRKTCLLCLPVAPDFRNSRIAFSKHSHSLFDHMILKAGIPVLSSPDLTRSKTFKHTVPSTFG